jgi:hypothetical protein
LGLFDLTSEQALQEGELSVRLGGIRLRSAGMAFAPVGRRDVAEHLFDVGSAARPGGLMAGAACCLTTHWDSLGSAIGSVVEGDAGADRGVDGDGDEQGGEGT